MFDRPDFRCDRAVIGDDLCRVGGGVGEAVTRRGPVIPARRHRGRAGALEGVHAEGRAGFDLDELSRVEALAEVGLDATVREATEVVRRHAVGERLRQVDVGERGRIEVVAEHFAQRVDLIEIVVSIVLVRRHAEVLRHRVGEVVEFLGIARQEFALEELVADGILVPRIGRLQATIVFLVVLKRVAVVVAGAIAVFPRADGGAVRERRRVHLVRTEHHIELPAIADAVLVEVGVVRLERVVLPEVLDVDFLLVADAERLEVADDEVLVERRERLGVHRVRTGHCRERVEAEHRIDLRMDVGDLLGRDRRDTVLRASFGRQLDTATTADVLDGLAVLDHRILVHGVELEALGRVADERNLRTLGEDVLVGGRTFRRVADGDDGRIGDREGHHVAVSRFVGIREVRVEVGIERLPAVGHAVVVGILLVLVGTERILVGVAETVVIGVGSERSLLLAFLDAEELRFAAVRNLVLVGVAVFDVDCDGRIGHHLVGDRDVRRRVDRDRIGADVVGVAPRLPIVAHTVVVQIGVGAQVVIARRNAAQGDIGRRQIVVVADGRGVGNAHARSGGAGEVGVLKRFDHNQVREVGRTGRTEVADGRGDIAVAGRDHRMTVDVGDVHLELAPLAPHRVIVGLVVLRVEERDTPEVVGVVVEDRRTVRRDAAARVEVRRDRVDRGARRETRAARQHRDAGIVDHLGHVRRGPDLEAVGLHRLVVVDEAEGRTRRVDRLGVDRFAERRDGALRAEGVDEAGDDEVRGRTVRHRDDLLDVVADADQLAVEVLQAKLLGVLDEPLPVKVGLGDRQDVGFRDVRTVIEDHRARRNRAHLDRLAFDLVLAVDLLAADGHLDRLLRDRIRRGFTALGARVGVGDGFDLRARDHARGILDLNDEFRRLVPADHHVLEHAIGLTLGELTVAVEVDERLNRVDALADAALGRFADPDGLRPVLADAIGPVDAEDTAVERLAAAGDHQTEVDGVLARAVVNLTDQRTGRAVGRRVVDLAIVAVGIRDHRRELLPLNRRIDDFDVRIVEQRLKVLFVRTGTNSVGLILRIRPTIVLVGGHLRLGEDAAARNDAARVEEAMELRLAEEAAEHARAGLDLVRGALDHEGRVDTRRGAGVGADHEAGAGDVLHAMIGDADADCRGRIAEDLEVAVEEAVDEVGRVAAAPGERTALGEVGPAILVLVVVRIVDAERAVVDVVLLLPPVFHEVMVGRNLAEVLVRAQVGRNVRNVRRTGEEVIHDLLVIAGAREQRVEEREAVHHAVRRRAEGEDVFRVVRETVLIGVVVRTILADAEEVFPPVGQVVAVFVDGRSEALIDGSVGLHAAHQVDDISLRGGHERTVVGDHRIPVERSARVEVVAIVRAGVFFPPVGQAVRIDILSGVFPRIGSGAVPVFRADLREGSTHRHEVARTDEVGADLVGVEPFDRLVLLAQHLAETIVRPEPEVAVYIVDEAAIGRGGVREDELVDALHFRRRVKAAELFAVEERINHAAVHNRQPRNGVLNPRNVSVLRAVAAELIATVDGRVRFHLQPPADGDRLGVAEGAVVATLELGEVRIKSARIEIGVFIFVVVLRRAQNLLLETGGHIGRVERIGSAGERLEVVVQNEFRRQRQLAVIVVARAATLPNLVYGGAVFPDIVERIALPVVAENFRARPRAVPAAHFVDVALEVFAVVGERFEVLVASDEVGIKRDRRFRLRTRAEEECARLEHVAGNREVVGAGNRLQARGDAVGGRKRGVSRVVDDAVDIEYQPLAVVGKGDMVPLVRLQQRTSYTLAADGRVAA